MEIYKGKGGGGVGFVVRVLLRRGMRRVGFLIGFPDGGKKHRIEIGYHLTNACLSVSMGIIVEGPCPELTSFRDTSS